jgi:hypothetical protein
MLDFVLLFFSQLLAHRFNFLGEQWNERSLRWILFDLFKLLLELKEQKFLLLKVVDFLCDKCYSVLNLRRGVGAYLELSSQLLMIDLVHHQFLFLFRFETHLLDLNPGSPEIAIFHCQVNPSLSC